MELKNSTKALIDNSTVKNASSIDLTASSKSKINAYTIAGGVGVAGGQGGGVAGALEGAGSYNTIENTVQASILTSKITNVGAITQTATDETKINAEAGAGTLCRCRWIRWRSPLGGAGSAAPNDIKNSTKATIEVSAVSSSGAVSLAATSTSEISAIAIGLSGSLSGGQGGGLSLAGAGSESSQYDQEHDRRWIAEQIQRHHLWIADRQRYG